MAPAKAIPNRFGLVGGAEGFDYKKESRNYGGVQTQSSPSSSPSLAKLPAWRPRTASGTPSARRSSGRGDWNGTDKRRAFSARTRIHGTGASNRKDVAAKEKLMKQKPARPMSASVVGRARPAEKPTTTQRPSTARARPRSGSADIRRISQRVKSDRLLSDTIRLKMNSLGAQMSQVRQYLWDLDDDKSGTITYDELEDCLTRFSFGLKRNEMRRVARTLDVDGSGKVKYQSLFNFFDNEHPLGLSDIDQAEDNIVYAAPWHKLRGKYRGNPADRKDITVPLWVTAGLSKEGTHEERASLRFLTNILKDKFMQSDSKLRRIFSKYDENRNGKICREEYLNGLHSMHLGIPDSYFNRLFDEVDVDKSGEIDYEEFVTSFDENNWFNMKPQEEERARTRRESVVATSFGKPTFDAEEDLSKPLPKSILLLQEKLLSAPQTAAQLFKKYDRNGDGYISRGELIEGITQLAPDLCTVEEIQEMITRFDKNGDNYFSYEEFAEYLQSSQNELDGEGKPRGGGEKESEASPKRVQTPPHRRYICSDPGKKFGRFASRPDHANTFNLIIPQAGFPGHLSAAKLYGESRNKWIVDMQGKDREEKRLNQQYKMRSQKRWNTILADRVNQTDIQIKGRDKANVSSIARQHRRFMERARLYEFMNEEIQDSSACLFTKNVF